VTNCPCDGVPRVEDGLNPRKWPVELETQVVEPNNNCLANGLLLTTALPCKSVNCPTERTPLSVSSVLGLEVVNRKCHP
jgi:hypothetical protein